MKKMKKCEKFENSKKYIQKYAQVQCFLLCWNEFTAAGNRWHFTYVKSLRLARFMRLHRSGVIYMKAPGNGRVIYMRIPPN